MAVHVNDLPAEVKALNRLFYPYEADKLSALIERSGHLVHYTSAETAASILKGRSVWMRNAVTMNDFSEVQYGLHCLHTAWKAESGRAFAAGIEQTHTGLIKEVEARFDAWQIDLKTNTYLTCLSEHLEEENQNGRLSMWRAYGGRSGVALVLNLTPFTVVDDKLTAYSSPVAYETPESFSARLGQLGREFSANREFLRNINRQHMFDLVFMILRFSALCTKHPGFAEEREWRIIYSPNIASSEAIDRFVETVRGIPQVVYKLPLINDPERGLHGADLNSLVSRIIIGPTPDQVAVAQALQQLLTDGGVENAGDRIHISGIPLRHY